MIKRINIGKNITLIHTYVHSISSVSQSVTSSSLWQHGLQHTTLPCPSPTSTACSGSCPSSWWCYPPISHPLSSPSPLPSIFPSITVFSKESALRIRWPEYWSFSFSISPSNEYAGLISFRIDWFDLFAVQGTLKGLFQHHSSKGKFFRVPLSLWSYSHIHTWLLEKP